MSGQYIHLVAVNMKTRAAIFEDDTILPITNLIDHFGEDTDEPKLAKVFVAGTQASGWLVIEMSTIKLLQPVH